MVTGVPVFKLVIDPNVDETDFSGVDFVALVDEPAIEKYFQAFNKQQPKIKFAVSNEEKRIVAGALMIPNLPIYRNDMGKEYYVIFDNKTIEQISQKFFKMGFTGNVNDMHQADKKIEGVYMVESFIINSARGICAPKGFEYMPDGTWFGSYKVENDEVWQQVKDGTFKGFSVEGYFKMIPDTITDEDMVNAIREAILQ